MLNDWMENHSLNRMSQILNVIYEMRMVTKEQLLVVTGLREENLNRIIKSIRKMPAEDPSEWLQTTGIRLKRKNRLVYSLGKRAIQFVQLQRKQEVRVREAPTAQMFHYIGINSILHRAIEACGRDQVDWFSESEQADNLYLQLKDREQAEPERRSIIRPDARIRVGVKDWFVEFDNATEGPRQLEIKFHRYVELFDRLDNIRSTPILWVTTTDKRRDYLRANWEATMKISYADHPNPPTSLFYVEGEETSLFQEAMGPRRRVPSLID